MWGDNNAMSYVDEVVNKRVVNVIVVCVFLEKGSAM